jgi:hypothetical protein
LDLVHVFGSSLEAFCGIISTPLGDEMDVIAASLVLCSQIYLPRSLLMDSWLGSDGIEVLWNEAMVDEMLDKKK